MKKTLSLIIAIMLVFAFTLSACGNNGDNGGNGDAADPPAITDDGGDDDAPAGEPTVGRDEDGNLTFQGTITFYAQAYTPMEPTSTNPNPPSAFWEVAEAWEALNPGIEIEFLMELEAGQDYMAWIQTRIAGGHAPDIFWMQSYSINTGALPHGSTLALNEFLDRPNHYVTGNNVWWDLFPQSVISAKADFDGSLHVINGDYVGTAVYFNRELFAQAGVAEPTGFVTWEEYTEISRQLVAAGITPWAFTFGNESAGWVTWLTRLFATNSFYYDFPNLAVLDPDKADLNSLEIVIAFLNGYFGVENEDWLAWWYVMLEHVENYMPDDVVTATSTFDTVLAQFLNGDIAMMWNGSWAPNDFEAANISFEFSSFPFPHPTTATGPAFTNNNSSASVGGPNAAFQYAVSSHRANESLTDEKLEAIIDWLMFISTPENNTKIVNDLGIFVPTMIGAIPLEANEDLVVLLELDGVIIEDGASSIGTEFFDAYFRNFQMFLRGDITTEEARNTLRPIQERALQDILDTLETDISAYLY